jgi:hypothetical protein
MLDQAIFTVCDFATGIVADKVTRVLGRLGAWVAAVTALSCAAFLALPFVAAAGAPLLIAVTVVWTITSSALRAPPLMLLGKYAAKPSIPYLSSLAMLGYGIAGALAPYLAITLRDVDPRVPFAVASIVLVLSTLGMISAERMLASQPRPTAEAAQVRAFGTLTAPAAVFALGMIVLALGYQMHFALDSAPLFRRFANPAELQWLMPVFWIGFNISMFPASVVTKRLGGYAVMGAAALIGALAILGAHAAQGLGLLVVAQFAAGGRLGCDPDERLHGRVCHWRERRRRPHVRTTVLDPGAGNTGAHGDGSERAQRRSGARGGAAMDTDCVLGFGGRCPALSRGRGPAALDGGGDVALKRHARACRGHPRRKLRTAMQRRGWPGQARP